MKKLFTVALTGVALASALGASVAQAGLRISTATNDWSTKEVESKYKVEVDGQTIRVHEWTPADNRNVRCVLVASDEGTSSVTCYAVENPKEKNC